LHFCFKSYQPIVLSSLFHITVISNIRQPHIQAKVGSPCRSNINTNFCDSDDSGHGKVRYNDVQYIYMP
jgi:hypothetical protein